MINNSNKRVAGWEDVPATEEKISKFEAKIKEMMAEVEKLKTELAEKNCEKVWKPEYYDTYVYLNSMGNAMTSSFVEGNQTDIQRIALNNVYHLNNETKEHLEWYSDNVLRVQNKLMQLHELLCPDYFPDWVSNKDKWIIYYDNTNKCFSCTLRYDCNFFVVCFTREAAEKACEILNKEKLMMESTSENK